MPETRKKTRKAAAEADNLITVDANRLREALKHTFEGVTMLFDCIGLNVPVGEPVIEQEEKPEDSRSAEQMETLSAENQTEAPEVPSVEKNPVEEKQDDSAKTETPHAAPTVTQDDITRIIVRKIKQDRSNNEKIGAILKAYGVAKVSDLPVTKYEAFLTDISQI